MNDSTFTITMTLALMLVLEALALPCSHSVAYANGYKQDSIKIATFNIRQFGPKKAANATVMTALANIVRNYDIVAVQEIQDIKGNVPNAFLREINNRGNVSYNLLLSMRTGQQADDKNYQEQYAYYYDSRTIENLDLGMLYDDQPQDKFEREPFVARFRTRSKGLTFVLITVHTRPEKTGNTTLHEIKALHDVVIWVRAEYPNENNFIVLGDFNADCDYVTEKKLKGITFSDPKQYVWIVPHHADTNISTSSSCAYDRIVVTPSMNQYFTRWGVDQTFTDTSISDHWPVWAEFRTE